MREVSIFLSASIFNANSHLVEGLRKNDIEVACFDYRDNYAVAVAAHQELLCREEGRVEVSPLLCIAFEDSRAGVRAAHNAGMCVVGIASNRIELDRLKSQGAHAAALSVSELLDSFGVRNYYQIQYLPYAIHLRLLAERKVGYPVSLLDTLRGKFVKPMGDGEEDDPDNVPIGSEIIVEIDERSQRIVPREVLGVAPGSLADTYINNVGWPQDTGKTFRLNSRELERDIVRMFAKLYRFPIELTRGFVTNGGTEGNFTGLWWQRDYLKDKSNGHKPVLLTSEQTHYSVGKAAQQLDIEGRLVATTRTGEIDCHALARLLDEIEKNEPDRPVLMQLNFGTTQTGALDDLPQVHRLLVEKVRSRGGYFSIHIDAALMGAVVPIINPFGTDVDYFKDFDVKTIAISGHKFFGSVCICGLCLTTLPFLDACFARKDVGVRYLTGLHDITPSGSRSGFNVLSFHNTLCGLYMHTDAIRLKQIVAQCYRNVDYFLERIIKLVGSKYVIHPKHSLTICFPRPSEEIMEKFSLMPVSMPKFNGNGILYAGVCILVNVGPSQIDRFLSDYALDVRDSRFLGRIAI